jgi:hypothetical protein
LQPTFFAMITQRRKGFGKASNGSMYAFLRIPPEQLVNRHRRKPDSYDPFAFLSSLKSWRLCDFA